MIHVIATLDLQPGKRESVLAQFRALVPIVRAEAGCLEYGTAIDIATPLLGQPPVRPDSVIVVEKWASLAALDAHLASPHMQTFLGGLKGTLKDVKALVLEAV